MKKIGEISYFSYPTPIHFGVGVRWKLPELLKAQSAQRPLFVTDRGVKDLPWFKELVSEVRGAGFDASVYSEIWGNPLKSQADSGTKAFKDHRADSIIAVGGGAALDVSKGVALMAHHPGDLLDYEDGKSDGRPIDQPIPFLAAIPTTAGTGSEVGRSGVVSDDKTHVKKIFFSPRLLPRLVLGDPELTVGLPAHLTAATGMDALTHLVEAYLSKGFHPFCDGIALEGVSYVSRSLEACVKEPTDLKARGDMLAAAMMGAVAFQKGLGVTHSLAHALSTVCDMHHGLANGILIPYAMKFNSKAVPDRVARLGAAAGVKASPEAFVQWLVDLKARTGIPRTLKDAGVKEDQLGDLVKIALKDGCHSCNPCEVTEADFKKLFLEAMGIA